MQAKTGGGIRAAVRAISARWAEVLSVVSFVAFVWYLGGSVLRSSSARPEHSAAGIVRHGSSSDPVFVDRAMEAGLRYYWTLDKDHGLDILQNVGNGCALLDYDNDGALDVLLVGPKLALYRGDGHGRFTDVTHAVGLDRIHGHFLGCAVGDYDNDGFDDIYVTAYQGGVLLHNDGGRRFIDVTRGMGLRDQPFGTSASFGDLYGTGRLDLVIGNYCVNQPSFHGEFKSPSVHDSPPYFATVWRNLGDRFEEVVAANSPTARVTHGRALGVCMADYDGSGKPSVAIANDLEPGDLLKFDKSRVRNIGDRAGTARGEDNMRHDGTGIDAGMGIDWGDYDNDGRLDLVVTTYEEEPKNVYHNDGGGLFSNRCGPLGVRAAMIHDISWGVKFFDYDNDGWLDLVIANGHVNNKPPDYVEGVDRFRQRPKLLHNLGGTSFDNVSDHAGPGFSQPVLGRGLAVGDIDNDGREDVLMVDSDGRIEFLRNETPNTGHWLSCRLIGTRSNRDGIGALVTFDAGGRKMLRYCHTDGSFMSASDRRVHCGLGSSRSATITVRWPSGTVDTYANVAADRVIALREGDSIVHGSVGPTGGTGR